MNKKLNEIKWDRKWNAYLELVSLLKKWIVFLTHAADLRDPSMRDRHWNMIMKIVKKEIKIDESTKLKDIFGLDVNKFGDPVD